MADQSDPNGRERLFVALDQLEDGITMHDSDLRLMYSNHAALELLDLPEELMQPGTAVEEVFRFNAERGEYGPGDPEEEVSKRISQLKRRKARCFERIRPDGTVVEIRGAPLEDGGFISIYKDVTQRKQAAEELRNANASLEENVAARTAELARQSALFEATLEHISQGISVFDQNLELALCNKTFIDLLDFPEEFGEVGTHIAQFFSYNAARGEYGEGDPEQLVQDRLDMAKKNEPHQFSRVLSDGTVIEISGNPMPSITGGFVTTYTDVTEKVHAQEEADKARQQAEVALARLKKTQDSLIQAEKMGALGQLVAGIAHEINTPVGVGLTSISHLEQKVLAMEKDLEAGKIRKSELTNFLQLARDGAALTRVNLQRAADLISSFKKIAVDQTQEKQRVFQLKRYTQSVFHSLLPQLRESPVKVELICDEAIEMNSYPGAYAQVISNLMINSLEHGFKAGEEGHIWISIEQVDSRVFIHLEDDGCGIPEENVPKIFDPFFRDSMGSQGTGLGLSVVYNIVQGKLCGEISCASPPGKGAIFKVDLPVILPSIMEHPCGVAPIPDL